VGANKQILQWC